MEAWISIQVLLLLVPCAVYFADAVTVPQMQMPVFTQTATTSNYIYQRGLPAMTENTMCFWYYIESSSWHERFMWSWSTASIDNTFTMSFSSTYQIYLYIAGTIHSMSGSNLAAVEANFLGWNKHCLTWKSGGTLKWYTNSDPERPETLVLFNSMSVGTQTIAADGALIMAQEQDAHFGSLDGNQNMPGKIAWVNVWNYEMTIEELNALGCGDQGNIVNWDTMSQAGSSPTTYEYFPCIDGPVSSPEFEKKFTGTNRQMTFCKIVGARVTDNVITEETTTKESCLLNCIDHVDCYSFNYQISTGTCQLNSYTNKMLVEFENNLSADFEHFSSRDCTVDA